jgi:hypothetical protein
MRKKSWYDLMDTYREATLEFAASCAEGYATFVNRCGCGRSGCVRCNRRSGRDCRGSGDFLADLVRVNVNYLGEIARLNSSYTVLASRFLDRVYSKVVYDQYRDSGEVTHLTAPSGQVAKGRLVICNELSRKIAFRIKGVDAAGDLQRKFTDVEDGNVTHELTLRVGREDGSPLLVDLEAKATTNFIISLAVPQQLKVGQYHARIKTKLDGEPRHFGLVLDVIP